MTQKKIWIPIVMVAFVAGTLMSSPQASAANPVAELIDSVVIPKLDQIIADIAAIDTGSSSGGLQVETFNLVYGGAGWQGGAVFTKTATSDADFTLDVCFSDDDATQHDNVTIKDGSTDLARLVPAGVTPSFTQCVTVGGQGGDSLTVQYNNLDGTKKLNVTLVTASDATASIS